MSRNASPSLPSRIVSRLRGAKRRLSPPDTSRYKLVAPTGGAGEGSFAFQRTLMTVRPDLIEERRGSETLIVCGAARGMTSAAAHALFELDMFLGERLQKHNFEDVDLRQAMPSKELMRGPLADRADFRRIVEERNARYDRWGFKIPHAVDHLPELTSTLRNPVVLLCVRNPIGTAKSVAQRSETDYGGLERLVHSSLAWVPALQFLLADRGVPALIADMDIVRRRPVAFVRDLAETFGLDGDIEGIGAQLSKRGYKLTEAKPGMEFVSLSEV